MKVLVVLVLLLCLPAAFLMGAPSLPSYLSLNLMPGMFIPLGEDSSYFNLGGGIRIFGEYRLPFFPLTFITADLGYDLQPVGFATTLSIVTAGGGGGVCLDLGEKFFVQAYTSGGYFYSLLNNGIGPRGGNPYIRAGSNLNFRISPALSMGIDLSYNNHLGLYNGLGLFLGTAFHVKYRKAAQGAIPGGGKYLQLSDISIEDIFPVFFKYYDDHPVGRAVLVNSSNAALENISVQLFVKQYMDDPKPCAAPAVLKPGERAEIKINALFTEKVLEITESMKTSAEITVEFMHESTKYRDSYQETMRIHDRNAMTWDDDRKASAFVTAKDPAVMTFSKQVAGIVRSQGYKAVPESLRVAMGLHGALSLYGLQYVVDPKTPYKEFSAREMDIDYLQFPRQTFQYRAGDCDDLSVLYCALLESVGIQTAFITVPGHIYAAFKLDMSPSDAAKQFLKPDDFIISGDAVWIPVETTEIAGGFVKAWDLGAKQWRENDPKNQATLLPMHESWQTFEPVGFPEKVDVFSLPSEEQIAVLYVGEVTGFIKKEIRPRVAALEEEIRNNQGDPKYINKLGVLYARFGLNDRAKEQFQRILAKTEYLPALVNLANLYFLMPDFELALEILKRASAQAPNQKDVLLALARVNHELENYGTAKKAYDKLKEIDPGLAERFAYLDLRGEEAARAAEAGRVREVILWIE